MNRMLIVFSIIIIFFFFLSDLIPTFVLVALRTVNLQRTFRVRNSHVIIMLLLIIKYTLDRIFTFETVLRFRIELNCIKAKLPTYKTTDTNVLS